MSQVPRRLRVRQLADSVWPGRNVNGYANLIAARLRKLADERATGVLPVSGHGEGAIFFFGGQVVYAESSRVPMAVPRPVGLPALGLVPAEDPIATERAEVPARRPPRRAGAPASGTSAGTAAGALVLRRSVSGVTGALDRLEPVIDAVTELLSAESRYARFRHTDEPPAIRVRPVPVETLLAEVQRRHALLRQLAPGVTPDTVLAQDAVAGGAVRPGDRGAVVAGRARGRGVDTAQPRPAARPERLRHYDRELPAGPARTAGHPREPGGTRRGHGRAHVVHPRRIRRERQRCVRNPR